MSGDPSISDVERDLEKATEQAADSSTHPRSLTLAWRDADPENRPEGMVWDPDDELVRKLMMVVDAIDDETARAIVMALQGHGESNTRFHEGQFRRQLSHRLDQAGIRADRSG